MTVVNPLHTLYLKTSSYNRLWDMTKQYQQITIKGPKGVGKSFSLVALLTQYSRLGKTCLFFNQESTKYPHEMILYLNKHLGTGNCGKLNICIETWKCMYGTTQHICSCCDYCIFIFRWFR